MSDNPFEDANDIFPSAHVTAKPPPRSSQRDSSRGSQPGAPVGGRLDPGAALAQQVAMRNTAANGGGSYGGGSEKAARMFAASQTAAAEAEASAAANASARLEGSAASAFNSRERNARYSTIQSGGGPGMAFPMTDMVDAAAEKRIGLSFAQLAVRDGGPIGGVQAESGVVASQAAPPVKKATKAATASQQAYDPWNSVSVDQAFAPAQAPAPVFRQPTPQQQPSPAKQTPKPQERTPVAASTLMDFDPLSFGDMGNTATKSQPSSSTSSSKSSAPVAPAPVQAKKPKKKPVVVESSESESSEEETDSDDEDEATRLAREKAARKAAKAAEALAAQRAKERAEAVAYDNQRKAALAAKRRSLENQEQEPRASIPASRSHVQSQAVDPDDEEARDVIRNETDHDKLQKSGTKGTYSKAVIDRWGENPAANWAYSKSKTRTKLLLPKVCVYWRFIWGNERHEVELFHSTVSGKRTIRCDGALVAQEKLFIDTGSRHDFTVGSGSNPCHLTVLICSSGSDYAYELFINRVRFYQALQSWLIDLQRDPSIASKLEPLSPHAYNAGGTTTKASKYR